MKTYLVGGAVRDSLLQLTVTERDFVVVGAIAEDLMDAGYLPVGKDFPVFLHPQTHEEYALARTERKSAPGYRGFVIHADPSVTLEQDLARRDLTINAMAQDEQGHIIDPYGGQADLNNRVLRHVSSAFAEDPVRILRLARFAARFHHLGFTIAPETLQLVQQMVAAGEVDHLVPERIWAELCKALQENNPQIFLQALREGSALQRIFPEIDALFGVPQPIQHHPELDTGIHTLLALQQAAQLSCDLPTRFAVLVHDLGKAVTPAAEWPRHIQHEIRGVPLVRALCARLRVPNHYRDLAVIVTEHHLKMHQALQLKATTLLNLFERLDAFRQPLRVEQYITACEADARGRLGLEKRDYPQAQFMQGAFLAAKNIDTRQAIGDKTGLAARDAIHRARLTQIKQYQYAYHHTH